MTVKAVDGAEVLEMLGRVQGVANVGYVRELSLYPF